MRIESAVTSLTWIPSEAVEGMPKLPFELGVARYRAKLAAERLGLPVILDRVADWRGGVWDGAA